MSGHDGLSVSWCDNEVDIKQHQISMLNQLPKKIICRLIEEGGSGHEFDSFSSISELDCDFINLSSKNINQFSILID